MKMRRVVIKLLLIVLNAFASPCQNNKPSDITIETRNHIADVQKRDISSWKKHETFGCYNLNTCNGNMLCSCDATTCPIYKDCCRDAFGSNGTMPKHFLADHVICQEIGHHQYIYVINGCPANDTSRNADLCLSGSDNILNIEDNAPVYSNRTHFTYRNKFCALCNDDYDDPITFNGLIEHKAGFSSDCGILLNKIEVKRLILECVITYSIPTEAKYVRFCRPNMINNCSATWSPSNGSSYIIDMCENGAYAPLYTNPARNIFCLFCNDFNDQFLDNICLDKNNIHFFPFLSTSLRIMLDLSLAQASIQNLLESPVCPDNHFIHMESTCYPIKCRFGYTYSPQENDCKKTILSILNVHFNFTMFLTVRNLSEVSMNSLFDLQFFQLQTLFEKHNIYARNILPRTFYLGYAPKSSDECLLVKIGYSFYHNWPTKPDFNEDFSKIAKENWQIPLITEDGNLIYPQPASLEDACRKCVVDRSVSDICSNYNVSVLSSDIDHLKKEYFPSILKCPMVRYPTDNLHNIVNEERLLILNETFTYDQEGNLYICLQTFKYLRYKLQQSQPLDFFLLKKFEIVLTYSTFGLSSLSLGLFLFVHYNDRKFQTTGGRNVLTLALLLLLAQITFVVSDEAKKWKLVCEIIGIFLHFLWTLVFFWMTISAFVLWKYFPLSLVKIQNNKQCYKYCTLACVFFSLLFVGPTVALHLLDNNEIDIRYGGSVCFLSTAFGILVGVYIPLGIMLGMSFTFLLHFLCLISYHKAKTSNLVKQRSYLFVFFRVASMFGFSWLIGMAASLLQDDILWTVFHILTGLHGFFLVLAFTSRDKIKSCFKTSPK